MAINPMNPFGGGVGQMPPFTDFGMQYMQPRGSLGASAPMQSPVASPVPQSLGQMLLDYGPLALMAIQTGAGIMGAREQGKLADEERQRQQAGDPVRGRIIRKLLEDAERPLAPR